MDEDIINSENEKKDSKITKPSVKNAVSLFRDCQHENHFDTDFELLT